MPAPFAIIDVSMPRSRDFFLFLLSALVLVGAIVATNTSHTGEGVASWWSPFREPPSETGANAPDTEPDYDSRIAELRAKLAKRMTVGEPSAVAADTTDGSDDSEPDVVVATSTDTATVQTCTGYQNLVVAWTPQTITRVEREGMRLYIDGPVAEPMIDSGTSTLAVEPISETVRLQVPMRAWPLPNSSCLPTDVIGVALDGSLIRNDETALYSVFGAETLIGYALDGYPIYGATPNLAVDACGGAMVAGQYRYVVDSERAGVITCFSGVPASIQ